MRSIPGMTFDNDRVISTAFTLRRQKQSWTAITSSDPTTWSYDADYYDTGILRVCVSSGTLRHQYIADPTGAWPAWTDSGISIAENCKIGLNLGRVFYHSGTSSYYRDFDGSNFGSATLMDSDFAAATPTCFMPFSNTQYFLYRLNSLPLSDDSQRGYLYHKTLTPTSTEWPGAVYGKQDVILGGDVVTNGGYTYVFLSVGENKKAVFIKHDVSYFHELKPILPLDVSDDTSYLRLGGVSVINSQIWVTGTLYRKNWVYPSSPMQVCMRMINDNFSMEKSDFYIGYRDHNKRNVTLNGQSVAVYDPPGKVLLVGDYLYFCAPGSVKKKMGTSSAGKDPASLKRTITKNVSASLNFDQESRLLLETLDDVDLTNTVPSDEVTVQMGYDEVLADIGVFDVDAVPINIGQTGGEKNIAATGRGMKRLRQWKSDAAYDFWSQTKEAGDPWDLGKLVRAKGKYTSAVDYLMMDDLNVDGFLYSVGRPSRNQLVRGKFDRNAGMDNQAGLFVGFYRETVEDAKTRTGKDEITDKDIGYHALVVKAGKRASGTGEGLGIWAFRPGYDPVCIAGVTKTIPTDQPFHLMAQMYEGRLYVHFRPDDDPNWSLDINHRFEQAWALYYRTSDQVGRGGVYMRNDTANSLAFGFDSQMMVIPVWDNFTFPNRGTLKVDDELIEYDGKSVNRPVDTGESMTWSKGNSIVSALTSSVDCDFGRYRQARTIRQSFVVTNPNYVRSIDIKIKKVNDPPDAVSVALYTDPVVPYYTPAGKKIAETTISASTLTTSFQVINVEFNTAVQLIPGTTYYLVIDRVGGVPFPKKSTDSMPDWYSLQVHTASSYGGGTESYFNDDNDSWTDQSRDMYFRIYGSPSPLRTQVMVTNSPGEVYQDQFKDMALACYDGKGAGLSLQITDFLVGQGSSDCYLVHKDPVGFFDTTSKFYLAPTLLVTKRGAQDTVASSHLADAMVNEYIPPTLKALQYGYFTSDIDMRLTDATDAICGKAGVSVTHEAEVSGTHTGGSGTWTYSTPVLERRGIVRLYSWENKGIAFDLDGSNNGKLVASDNTYVYLYDLTAGVPSLVERVYNPHKWWTTFSFQGEIVSVWAEDRLLASFIVTDNERAKASVASNGSDPVNIDWKELDMRVDNFVMEMGQDGFIIFQEVARETRAFLHDTSDGNLRLFRNRTEINTSETAWDIVFDTTVQKSDAGMATRVRLIGIEEIELPADQLDSYGDIFQTINLDRADSAAQMLEAWPYIKEELDYQYEPRIANGAFHPALEPNDIIYIRAAHPSGVVTEEMVVESMTVTVRVSEDEAIMDMGLSGYI